MWFLHVKIQSWFLFPLTDFLKTEWSSGDQPVLRVEICNLVALAVGFIVPISYRCWWVAAFLPLWYSRATNGLTNISNTAWKIRALSVHSRGCYCSISWMHHMLVALLSFYFFLNSLKSFHCSFPETSLEREVEEHLPAVLSPWNCCRRCCFGCW